MPWHQAATTMMQTEQDMNLMGLLEEASGWCRAER